jgi:hypothetical protein
VVRAGSADLGSNGGRGARGRYLDKVRINPPIFFNNIIERNERLIRILEYSSKILIR